MAADLIRGFRQQKFWFPSKYFSINATSLTIIAVAVKLSVDLNTAMPHRVDQLAKLSSGALLSTVMGNSMPSLGAMNNTDLCTNMIALGILVITVIVNIGIQLGTGVIYLYWKEQAFMMFLMLILLPPVRGGPFSYMHGLRFCTGESEYKWSTVLVLITQTIAVGVGTIAPAIRWFIALDFRCPTRRERSSKRKLTVERYWIQLLVEMKDCPLTIRIQDRFCRKLAHYVKSKLLDICIGMQTGIVLGSKDQNHDPVQNQTSAVFVLHLEGEEELVELMMKKNFDATDHWLRRGKGKQPKHLMELLEKSTVAEGFKGVKEFDSDLVRSLDCDEPPNCWALPVVTLTAIAVALPNVSGGLMKQLVLSVHEGLMYVRLIEDNLDAKGELTNSRKAANVVWLGVDLYSKWLDVDLRKLSVQAESTKEILEKLSDVAKTRAVIEREYCVRKTVHILGETEKIRKLLDQQPVSTLDPDQMACIEEWRSLNDLKISSPFIPSSADSETVFSTSSDLYLTME
ncbi:hypothetical protein OIU78_013932 [Salix suchowensis]|nr:hypothetical protein OIU78_013932 [Salix suchowensis]